MSNILRNLKSVISCSIRTGYFYRNVSYSQEGEDLLISKLLPNSNGFYVDVGAHHPYRYSNTYLLYKRGWKGINIDPDERAIELFKIARPKDTNLNLAVGKKGKDEYYIFRDTALNTLSKIDADQVTQSKQSTLIGKKSVDVYPLSEILNKYARNKIINFLNIDVEGWEMAVLESNDWKKYKPQVIAMELLSAEGTEEITKQKPVRYLLEKSYSLQSRTINTLIFRYHLQ